MPRLLTRLLLGLALVVGLVAGRGFAQTSAPSANPAPAAQAGPASNTADRLAQLEQQIADARSSGDNAWMLTSAALVLLMTGPGLALFYAGLVRKKNVLATMMQSFTLMVLVTVLWALFGYSLVFHEGGDSWEISDTFFSAGWAGRLTRITPPPFHSRLSWSTN